jgi:hypothetical protein
MYLVFSVFTSRTFSLLACNRASGVFCVVFAFSPNTRAVRKLRGLAAVRHLYAEGDIKT